MRVMIAGVGNVLRCDDGLGVVVAHRLAAEAHPDQVEVVDIGIGGIHLVQHLMQGVDALVVVDAVDLQRRPGTIAVIRPDVEDVRVLSTVERLDRLADMHYAEPGRALMLARALGVLPNEVWIVGCQPRETEMARQGLTPAVASAVPRVAAEVKRLVNSLGIPWEDVD